MSVSNSLRGITKSKLNRILAIAGLYIAVGVVVFHILEDFGWIDSLYYVIVTLATVGYGDLAPQTPAGRLFAVFYIVFGVVIFIMFAKAMLLRQYRRQEVRKRNKVRTKRS